MPTLRRASHRAVPASRPRTSARPHRLPRLLGALLLPGLLIAGALAAPVDAAADTSRYIVLLHKGASVDKAVSAARERTGRTPQKVFRHAVKGYATSLTASERRRLAKDPAVEAIVPDSVVQLTAQSTPANIRRVRATAAPATHIDQRDVAGDRINADIAIIDTGIQAGHPDLNVRGGINCTGEGSAGAWGDNNGHGTHVAGVAAAIDNGIGVVGTAPGARLWAVRVFRPDGYSLISWIVCGIDWVTAQRDPNDPSKPLIEVANMSLRDEGGDDRNCGYSNNDPEHRAICASVAQGITYVVSSGNDATSSSAWRPASYDEVITVSAIADFDGIPGTKSSATCSSFGRRDVDDTFADFANRGSDVDITAPGVCVRSTYKGSSYATISGTSMSTPAVAGAAAVYKALHPDASPARVRLGLRAMASFDWRTSTDPDGIPDPLLDMTSLGKNPDFTITPKVGSARLWAGVSATTVDLRVRRGNGYDDSIQLGVTGLPAGVTASFDRDELPGLADLTARLTLRADEDAKPWSGTVTITGQADDRTRTAPIRLTISVDSVAPRVSGPRLALLAGQRVGSSIIARLQFPSSDSGTGIAKTSANEQVDGGSWQPVSLASATTTSATRRLAFHHAYVHRVTVRDRAGNATTRYGPRVIPRAVSERSASFSGRWGTSTASSAWGSRLRFASTKYASATFRFTGRSVGWVSTRGPARGQASIYIDGRYAGRVDLRSSSVQSRMLVLTRSWTSAGTHTLKIVVLGTSGRPRIDVDGIVVLP